MSRERKQGDTARARFAWKKAVKMEMGKTEVA